MSRSMLKVLILGAMLVTALTSVSSASATNWQSNGSSGGTAFAASGVASKVATSLPNGFGYFCTGGSLTGNVFGPTGPVNTSPWIGVESITPAYTGCNIAGTFVSTSITSPGQFDATSYASPDTTGRYTITYTATWVTCPFTVAVDAPAVENATTFTVKAAGQSTTVSWPNTTACKNATGTSGAGSSASVLSANTIPATDLVYTFTGTAPSVFY